MVRLSDQKTPGALRRAINLSIPMTHKPLFIDGIGCYAVEQKAFVVFLLRQKVTLKATTETHSSFTGWPLKLIKPFDKGV